MKKVKEVDAADRKSLLPPIYGGIIHALDANAVCWITKDNGAPASSIHNSYSFKAFHCICAYKPIDLVKREVFLPRHSRTSATFRGFPTAENRFQRKHGNVESIIKARSVMMSQVEIWSGARLEFFQSFADRNSLWEAMKLERGFYFEVGSCGWIRSAVSGENQKRAMTSQRWEMERMSATFGKIVY